jgi:U4/U6 small nuclear ribonucleoprotein PRP4
MISDNAQIAAAAASGNINIASNVEMEVMELSEDSRQAQLQHAEILRKYEAQKRGRSIVVPTAIDDVKSKLRELNEAVTLFGEGHADRRERLRNVIGSLELGADDLSKLQLIINQSSSTAIAPLPQTGTKEASKINQKEVFYSPVVDKMIITRKELIGFSTMKAQERLANLKRTIDDSEAELANDQYVRGLYTSCRDMALNSSQFCDERPVSCVRYDPSGTVVATGSLSCHIKLWNVSDLGCVDILRGHDQRVTSISWHPDAYKAKDTKALLASSSADGTCKIWDCSLKDIDIASSKSLMDVDEDKSSIRNAIHSKNNLVESKSKVVTSLKGHQGVVNKCEFHPNGQLIGTASSDYTWRLWDVESESEILLQDGHVTDCTTICFHHDGSLLLTADAAGVALLWDLRSGQQIHVFQGHIKKITSASFNSNGFQVATGSIDNTIRIWDLRKKKCSYLLPSNSNLISDIHYSKSGETLLSSSFDATMKIYGTRDYQLLRTLSGHLGKVMSCDFSPDEKHVISGGYDKTLKLWANKDEF